MARVLVAAQFVGGPLHGRVIQVEQWDGHYWHSEGDEAHVYERRFGHVVDKHGKTLAHSPQVYEHRPAQTKLVRSGRITVEGVSRG